MAESDDALEVLAMLRRGRLALDACESARTTFITHVGAVPKLVPGAWMGHRDLIRAMALANLHPQQRAALAGSVLVDYGHEFGVGRLRLVAHASGLPLGGTCVWMESRTSGVSCLYAWALGRDPTPHACDWLALRAHPGWAIEQTHKTLSPAGLSTLCELAGSVLVLVSTAVSARAVADSLAGVLEVSAHARFSPYLDTTVADAPVVLWPIDALGSAVLSSLEFGTVVPLAATETEHDGVSRWADERRGLAIASACEPGYIDRPALERFWRACRQPKILVRGDPQWTAQGSTWLRSLGADVHVEPTSTQLGLF